MKHSGFLDLVWDRFYLLAIDSSEEQGREQKGYNLGDRDCPPYHRQAEESGK